MADNAKLATTTCLEGVIPIVSGLAGLHASSELSDFTIKTTDNSIAVHRVILKLHSSVLGKACNGDFRESSQAFIDLLHEPADCVKAMVHYMYHFDYDAPEDEAVNPSAFHVEMAIIADKYDIAALKDAAFIKCKATLPTSADKADVFAETIDLAYDHAFALPDICKYMVTFALDNAEVGVSAEFHPSLKKVIQKHPDLAMNITEAMHARLMEKPKLGPDVKAYTCRNCGRASIFMSSLVQDRIYSCNCCGYGYSGSHWAPTILSVMD